MTVKHECRTNKKLILMSEWMWCHESVDPLLYNCPVLVEFVWFVVNCVWNLSVSLLLCVKVDFGCSQFVVQNGRIPPQNANLIEELSSWTAESFFPCKMTWFAPQWWFVPTLGYSVCWSGNLFLSSTVQDTIPEGVLSLCWCSRTLTLTTSIGI